MSTLQEAVERNIPSGTAMQGRPMRLHLRGAHSFFRQDCKFNIHKKCMEKVPMDCAGEAPKEWSESLEKENPDDDSDAESEHSGEPKGNGLELESQLQLVTYVADAFADHPLLCPPVVMFACVPTLRIV